VIVTKRQDEHILRSGTHVIVDILVLLTADVVMSEMMGAPHID
jgi:hypothetical protein